MAIPIILKTSSILGWKRNQPWKFQPMAAGKPTHWTATGLPPGMAINPDTGLIAGSVPDAGVWVAAVTASNADGQCTEGFPIGIDQERYWSETEPIIHPEAILLEVVLPAATVRLASGGGVGAAAKEAQVQDILNALLESWAAGTEDREAKQQELLAAFRDAWEATPSSGGTSSTGDNRDKKPPPVFALKSDDVRQLIIKFVDTEGMMIKVVPQTVRFSSKRFEPEMKVFSCEDFEVLEPGLIEMIIEPSGQGLNAELAESETDDETAINVLCEIEWTNRVGLHTLRTSTPNFHVRVERDLSK